MMIILTLIVIYALAFIALVVAGHESGWPDEYGFLYSRNEGLDVALGLIFWPAYRVARVFGIQRLNQPQQSVS
jgi:hypothetical protein